MNDRIEKQGQMRLNVNFVIDASEMKDWHPDRIAQFFRGIAMSIRARAGMPGEPDGFADGGPAPPGGTHLVGE